MNITITIQCDDAQEAQNALVRLASVQGVEYVAKTETEAPKRTRKTKAETAAELSPPVAQVNSPQAPDSAGGIVQPLVPATAAVAITPQVQSQVAGAAVTQQDLLKAFVALGQSKGPAAMKEVLAIYGAAAVTAIPPTQWAAAIAEANKRTAQ